MYVNGKTLVRTRVSLPPENLHVGAARCALHNYLYAKRYGGSFILRLEDRDKHNDEVIKSVLDGLRWLGVECDVGPVFQSDRKKHYREVAEGLLRDGKAYPEPPTMGYDPRGVHRNISPILAYELYDDTGWSLRYKIDNGRIVLDDLIRGGLEWEGNDISDPIILRSDGVATSVFANAVDDADMKITHVIRSEEHVNDTPVQLLLHNEFGNVPPFYAHMPVMMNGDKKFSKRDLPKTLTPEVCSKFCAIGFKGEVNPALLSYYKAMGHKPEAVANHLFRLDGNDILSKDKMVETFDFDRSQQFSTASASWFGGEYTRREDLTLRALRCGEVLMQAKLIGSPSKREDVEKIRKIVDLCGERIKVYTDILTYAKYFFRRPTYSMVEVEKWINCGMREYLELISNVFLGLRKWTVENIGEQVKQFMDSYGSKTNKLVQALRVAITGGMIGPVLFHSMDIIGRDECVSRIKRVLELSLPITYCGDI